MWDEADQAPRRRRFEVRRVAPVDVDAAAVARARALEGPEQRRLAGAVATHERGDLASVEIDVDVSHRGDRSVAHDEPAPAQRHDARLVGRFGCRAGRLDAVEVGDERGGPTARVADRQGKRRPTRPAAELDDRRRDGRVHEDLAGLAVLDRSVAGEVHDPVRVLDHPFEAVLRHHDGDTEVVHETRDRREHLLGARRVERRRRLVEHQHLGVRGEHCADRRSLQLPGRQLVQRAVPEVRQPEQVERLLDALAHHRRGDRELLHAVRELFLERVRDAPGDRVLRDDADEVCELARWVRARVASVDGHAALQPPAGEVGNQPVDRAEQRRLPAPGRADDHAQLARGDIEVDVAQRRPRRVGIRDRDVLEADHADTPAGCRAVAVAVRRSAAGAATGGGGVSAAGRRVARIAAVGSSGRPGHASGKSDGLSAPASRLPTTTIAAAATTPDSAVHHSANAHGSGR